MEQQNTIQPAIVKKASQGDGDAQNRLYRQYSTAMFNICLRMTGNRNDAEDLLQNAFIQAFNNLKQLKQPAYFGGWLRRIVVNECIRHSRRAVSWNDLEEQHIENISNETEAWWVSIDAGLIHAAIKELPQGCRQVFILYVLEDFPHKQIAESLGISESTSKSQYQRARKLLKERITQHITIHG